MAGQVHVILVSRKKQNITRKATAELWVPEAASSGMNKASCVRKSIEKQARSWPQTLPQRTARQHRRVPLPQEPQWVSGSRRSWLVAQMASRLGKLSRIQAPPASHMVQIGRKVVKNWDKDGVGGVRSGICNSNMCNTQPDLLRCWKWPRAEGKFLWSPLLATYSRAPPTVLPTGHCVPTGANGSGLSARLVVLRPSCYVNWPSPD